MGESTVKPKMITIERAKFALIVKFYRKSLYMIKVLTYICKDKNLDNMTFLASEITEVLEIKPEELEAARLDGTLRYHENEGLIYYEMNDLVRFKTRMDMVNIYKLLDEVASQFPTPLEKV